MPDPDPYLVLMDPDPGSPKTYGSCGSGSATQKGAQRKLITIIYPHIEEVEIIPIKRKNVEFPCFEEMVIF